MVGTAHHLRAYGSLFFGRSHIAHLFCFPGFLFVCFMFALLVGLFGFLFLFLFFSFVFVFVFFFFGGGGYLLCFCFICLRQCMFLI